MSRSNKTRRNSKKKIQKKKYSLKRSRVMQKRINIMSGGNNFPATFSNDVAAISPQSYLPYNGFANDPNYSVFGSRNTGPFLTGVSSTGGSRTKRRQPQKRGKIRGGGGDGSSYISNMMNTVTNQTGLIPAPSLNESSGVAGIMSGFSNTGSVYNPTPVKIAPLA